MKKLVIFLILFCLSILIFSSFFNFELSIFLLLPSFLILLIISFPLLINNDNNLFSPLAYLVYWVFLSVFMRMLYIIYDYPSQSFIQLIFLHDNQKMFLIKPLLIVIISMIAFTSGFLIKPKTRKRITEITIDSWDKSKIYLLGSLFTIISAFALYKFVSQNIGGILLLTIENISNYRGVSNFISDYSASGFSRIMIQLSEISFLVLYSYNILSHKKDKPLVILASLNFFIVAFFYFFTQSRSGLLLLLINPFVLNYLLKEKKINAPRVLIFSFVAVFLFSFTTSFRTGVGLANATFSFSGLQKAVDPLIANNGGFDISKTGLIMDFIDKNEEKQIGKTFAWIVTSFIPRSIWPSKPVSIDTYFGMNVYGATSFGTGAVPPGLFVELYWNFGYAGILIGCFIFGVIVRWIGKYFLVDNKKNINSTIIYVVCFMSIGVAVLGSSISSTVIGILYKLVPLIVFLKFITDKKAEQSLTRITQ